MEYITKQDIKEFIKREEKILWRMQKGEINFADMLKEREELAGPKLITKSSVHEQ